jgi:DnaJ-class molecular chaperone
VTHTHPEAQQYADAERELVRAAVTFARSKRCDECGGTGEALVYDDHFFGEVIIACHACNGTGQVQP